MSSSNCIWCLLMNTGSLVGLHLRLFSLWSHVWPLLLRIMIVDLFAHWLFFCEYMELSFHISVHIRWFYNTKCLSKVNVYCQCCEYSVHSVGKWWRVCWLFFQPWSCLNHTAFATFRYCSNKSVKSIAIEQPNTPYWPYCVIFQNLINIKV